MCEASMTEIAGPAKPIGSLMSTVGHAPTHEKQRMQVEADLQFLLPLTNFLR